MGIFGLINILRPYATEELLEDSAIVIDGNSLAHHLYYLWLSTRSFAQNEFDAQPSYCELSEFTIAWLDSLFKGNIFL